MTIRFKGFSIREPGVRAHLDMARPSARATKAFYQLHVRIADDMLPYMPTRTGGFRERTRAANAGLIGSGWLYAGVGPMGRYLYRNRVMVDAETGNGPRFIPGVGPRFERGATLTVTGRPLRYTSGAARPAWFEYAKGQRMGQWTDEVQRILDGA